MENAERTAAYHETLAERRRVLAKILATIPLASGRPLIWELGCGHGHFLNAYASAHPDQICIGVDIVGERIVRAEKKRTRARLENLHFLHTEARMFLAALPANIAFAKVFILFPDPWPKARHHKHRILQTSFLHALARHATAETRVYFRTDYLPYFQEARQTIEEDKDWKTSAENWPFEHSTVFQERAEGHHSFVAQLRSSA